MQDSAHRIKGAWRLLLVRLPGMPPKPAALLLHDLQSNRLHVASVRTVSTDAEVEEIWIEMAKELARRAASMSGSQFLAQMDGYSHFLELDPAEHLIDFRDPDETIADLFSRHVLHGKAFGQQT